MNLPISNKQRAIFIGISILVAYSMLTYTITGNIRLGIITDILSGLAVLAIPLLLFPFFDTAENKKINYAYIASRGVEGILMIIGGIFILIPQLEPYRNMIYEYIHIHFFLFGALLLYILLYRTQIVPRFISIWGIIATVMLATLILLGGLGFDSPFLGILILPMILNEFFLAFWLMIKGFKTSSSKDRN